MFSFLMVTSLNKLDGLYSAASSNHTDIMMMTHCYFSLLINLRAYVLVKAVIIKIQSHKAAKSSQF